ncbi:MAG: ABC transporter ATP-binding protein [Oscillospiraceae bacterium]|jgi:iron complex transport system ATP-binding protein|nr:ABC transporter ATP-binding protein [Oscillospiraceae bacterium]
MTALLDVKNITVRYGSLTLLDDVSFTLNEGEWLMVCGPNGAGKSTLVGAITQGVPHSGETLYRGKNLKNVKPSETAKYIGVLQQSNSVGYAFSVEEVIRLGRYAHSRGFFAGRGQSGEDDETLVSAAIAKVGLEPFLKQSIMTLSGGELQRTFLAQVFAQNPQILILDEPTNHLDLVYQQRTFELIRGWLTEAPGRAVISVVHDLNLAKAYGTSALLLNRGKTVAHGNPAAALSAASLQTVYEMDVYKWMHTMLSQWED